MIQQIFEIECDNCTRSLIRDVNTKQDAIDAAEDAGWMCEEARNGVVVTCRVCGDGGDTAEEDEARSEYECQERGCQIPFKDKAALGSHLRWDHNLSEHRAEAKIESWYGDENEGTAPA